MNDSMEWLHGMTPAPLALAILLAAKGDQSQSKGCDWLNNWFMANLGPHSCHYMVTRDCATKNNASHGHPFEIHAIKSSADVLALSAASEFLGLLFHMAAIISMKWEPCVILLDVSLYLRVLHLSIQTEGADFSNESHRKPKHLLGVPLAVIFREVIHLSQMLSASKHCIRAGFQNSLLCHLSFSRLYSNHLVDAMVLAKSRMADCRPEDLQRHSWL